MPKRKKTSNIVFGIASGFLAISIVGLVGTTISAGSKNPNSSDTTSIATKHSIKVDESVHAGTIVHIKDEAVEGEEIAFTVEIGNTKEYISAVKMNGEILVPVDGTYKFIMPAENVVILVEYKSFYEITLDSSIHSGTEVVIKNADGNEVVQAKEGDEIYLTVRSSSTSEYITAVKMNGTVLEENSGSYKFIMPVGDALIGVEYKNYYTLMADKAGHNDTTVTFKNASGNEISYAKEGEDVYVTVSSDSSSEYIVGVKMNGTTLTQSDGVYKFVMPAENVVITVEYKNYYNISVNNDGHNDTVIVVKDAAGNLISKAKEGDQINFTVSCSSTSEYIAAVKVNGSAITDTEGIYSFTMPAENVSITIDYKSYYTLSVSKHDTTTVTVKNSAGNDITSSKEGETISVTVTNNSEDEYIVSVKMNGTELGATDGTYSFTMPAENVSIVVEYKSFYTISYNAEGRTDTTVTFKDASGNDATKLKEGDKVSVTVSSTASTQYISSIKANGTEIGTTDGTYEYTMPAENVTVTVEYMTYHTVTTNYDGHTGVKVRFNSKPIFDQLTNVKAGETVSMLVMSASSTEYVSAVKFNDQYATSIGGYNYYFVMPDEDVTITFDYKPKFNLTFDSSVHSNTSHYFTDQWGNIMTTAKDGATVNVVVNCTSTTEYITSVKFNGVEIGTGNGTYAITVGTEDVVISLEYKSYYTITMSDSTPATFYGADADGNIDTATGSIANAESGDIVYISIPSIQDSVDYEVYANGVICERVDIGSAENPQYVYKFTMPEANVTVTYKQINFGISLDESVDSAISLTCTNESNETITKAKEGDKVTVIVNNTDTTREVGTIEVYGEVVVPLVTRDAEGNVISTTYSFTMKAEAASIKVNYKHALTFTQDKLGAAFYTTNPNGDLEWASITSAAVGQTMYVQITSIHDSPDYVVYANGVACEEYNYGGIGMYLYKFTMPDTSVNITYQAKTTSGS